MRTKHIKKTKQEIALFNSFLGQKGEKDQSETFTPKELDSFSVATGFPNLKFTFL